MPDEIKSINITGNAAVEITGGKRTRRSTKKKQNGGAEELRGVSPIMNSVKGIESNSSVANSAGSFNSNSWLKYPSGAPVPPVVNPILSYIPSSPDRSGAPTVQYAQAGGKQNNQKIVKVELKKKNSAKKVHLNPKKSDVTKHLKKHQTKKNRKVTLGISNLHKRITRAKKLHRKMKDMPIEVIKDKLIKGGLIKANSKAPESILRQIAADSEVVKNKAL
jgi:hypothetical protein